MADTGFKVVGETAVMPIRMAGCGHVIYMGVEHQSELRATHQNYWCTICGNKNYFPGESAVEALKRQLATKDDMLNTARAQRDDELMRRRGVEKRLSAQRGATKRIKNRVGNGVCPCCTRSFSNLRSHMTTKHPAYIKEPV